MKRVYKKYIKFIDRLPGLNHYFKMYVAEHYALFKKKKLINTVKWSKDQEKEFDQFWKSNYKKIKKSGNKLFEAFNEKFEPKYIPDFLYATKIESKFNSFQYANIYSDKSLTEILYKGKSKALLPKTYLLKAGGILYDSDRNLIDKEVAKEILLGLTDVVVKPTVGGNSGKGVIVGSFDADGYDKDNDFNILSILENDQDNYIVQEKIIQSDELDRLYSKSINTFRVITFISNYRVNLAPISLRVGSGGKTVDNIHAGGLAIGVDSDSEQLLKEAYKLGYSESKLKFEKHPDTGTVFEGFKVEGIKSIIESAIILHGQTPHIGIVSWDFTLNKEKMPMLIEANFTGQAVWLPQIITGKPVFGENTADILKKLS